MPRVARGVLAQPELQTRFEPYLGLNPYYQRALLDADEVPDAIVQIVERASGKRGLLIVFGRDFSYHVLGAGTAFGNGGDDFRWAWIWRVESRTFNSEAQPVGREVLYVEKPESAGGVIWWNGTSFVWTQHGD